jgi:hypothetical protein
MKAHTISIGPKCNSVVMLISNNISSLIISRMTSEVTFLLIKFILSKAIIPKLTFPKYILP